MSKTRPVKKLVANSEAGKWWVKKPSDSEKKWKTMVHNGVVFPEPYEALPKTVRIRYNGVPITLDSTKTNNPLAITAEEAAMFYAAQLERDNRLAVKKKDHTLIGNDKVFTKNFFTDWKGILASSDPAAAKVIKDFSKVDFTPMVVYISASSDAKKASNKALTKEDKEIAKAVKEEVKELYGYALIDGIKIPVGNYMIQPPGLYLGHGEHPLRGKIKKRMSPADVTLNCSKNQVPECRDSAPPHKPCKWGDVVENREVTWIGSWTHPITQGTEYFWLNRTESHWVAREDMEKFDKARELEKKIGSIRKKYTTDLSSADADRKALATAVYFLDTISIRPGTEKDEETEVDTLGLTTLKCENIKLHASNSLTVDFTGKSSIQFTKTLTVPPAVYKNIKAMCSGAGKKGSIFSFNATTLNDYLKTLMRELTSKVFRTWKASSTMQKELDKAEYKVDDPDHIKKLVYNSVAIEVAKALNHKRMTNNEEKVSILEAKIEELQEKLEDPSVKTAKQRDAVEKSIALAEAKLEEAQHNLSTSTSKVNYLDPRISVAWAKRSQTPIESLYNKTQLKKFIWAMETPSDWHM